MKLVVAVFLFLIGTFVLEADVRDLNKLKQDFVLETKKINVPGFPEAFNPSIVRWQNKLLMSFRSYHPETRSTDLIGLVWLDEQFNPASKPVLLEREGEVTCHPSRAQDPRLIVVGDELYIVYNNFYPFEEKVSRMVVGKVEIEADGGFKVSFPTPIIYFEGEDRRRKEKNWVPFVYRNTLLLAYSIQPHRLFVPVLDMNLCMTLVSTIGKMDWEWGELRGGTPALLVDDYYLAFFHSDKAMATRQSGGKVMNHYFMGAYTFQPEYPFAITAISPHPIVAKTFYEGPMHNTWKPLRVVFPGGYIVDKDAIWVAYGRQDHEIWVVKLDKAKLIKSLKPVQKPIVP